LKRLQTLTIPVTFTNVGAAPVSFTWTDSISWIKAGYPSGTLTPGQSRIFTITANISGLAAGSYNGIATVTAGGITKQVPVTLALSAAALVPAIELNTTSLGFAGTVGGTNPSAQTIAVSNVGSGTLSWAASDNAAWLTLSPVSGTNSGTVTTSMNLTGLAAGTFSAIITVAASGSTNNPQQIPVSLPFSVTAANTATLAWSTSNESDLAGYKVYRGRDREPMEHRSRRYPRRRQALPQQDCRPGPYISSSSHRTIVLVMKVQSSTK